MTKNSLFSNLMAAEYKNPLSDTADIHSSQTKQQRGIMPCDLTDHKHNFSNLFHERHGVNRKT